MSNKQEINFMNGVALGLAKHAYKNAPDYGDVIFGPSLYINYYTGELPTGVMIDNNTLINISILTTNDNNFNGAHWYFGDIFVMNDATTASNMTLFKSKVSGTNKREFINSWAPLSIQKNTTYNYVIDTASAYVSINGDVRSYPFIDYEAKENEFEITIGFNNGGKGGGIGFVGASLYVSSASITNKSGSHYLVPAKKLENAEWVYGMYDKTTRTFIPVEGGSHEEYQKF